MRSIDKLCCASLLAGALSFGVTGCGNKPTQAAAENAGPDPSGGNLAPVDQTGQPGPQPPAPQPPAQQTVAPQSDVAPPLYQDETEAQATQPPPPLPQYSQPAAPGDNYVWTPGYWNYAPTGYYWVPGAWVLAPYVGALWTPPYWDFSGGRYLLHQGYWGPYVGFYGGINYGFGYTGRGYYGGYWNNGAFFYNRAVTNVNNSKVSHVYSRNVANNRSNNRISYNGGRGGINARPSPQETAAFGDRRAAPVAAQIQHAREAASNRSQFASVNRGRPSTLAASQPLSTTYKAPAARLPEQRQPAPQARPQAQPNARAEGRQFPGNPTSPQRNGPAQQVRPQQARPQPERRPAPTPQQRPSPGNRTSPQQNRQAPQVRPAGPAPGQRQQPAPNNREARPAPQNRTGERRTVPQTSQGGGASPARQQRPVPGNRPSPQEARPAPQGRGQEGGEHPRQPQ